jgi:hypothetical protein
MSAYGELIAALSRERAGKRQKSALSAHQQALFPCQQYLQPSLSLGSPPLCVYNTASWPVYPPL